MWGAATFPDSVTQTCTGYSIMINLLWRNVLKLGRTNFMTSTEIAILGLIFGLNDHFMIDHENSFHLISKIWATMVMANLKRCSDQRIQIASIVNVLKIWPQYQMRQFSISTEIRMEIVTAWKSKASYSQLGPPS